MKLTLTYDGVPLDLDTDDIPNRLIRPMQQSTGWTLRDWWQALLGDDTEAYEWCWRFACLTNGKDAPGKDEDFYPGRCEFDFHVPEAAEEPSEGPTGPDADTESST